MKQKNLLIICITLIIVVAIGAFALVYLNSNNNQVSNNSNNETVKHSPFTNDDLAKDNTETYGLNVGSKDIIFIKGYGHYEKFHDSGSMSQITSYGELFRSESFNISLSNGDWYIIGIDQYNLNPSLNNGKNQAIYSGPNSGVNPDQDYPVCGYTYGTGGYFYNIGITKSNNRSKYMTVDFLKSILHIND